MTLLLNFINSGFIITFGLLLIISGVIMLFFYKRLKLLENSIIEHGKILQNFIINYNNHLQNNTNQHVNEMQNEIQNNYHHINQYKQQNNIDEDNLDEDNLDDDEDNAHYEDDKEQDEEEQEDEEDDEDEEDEEDEEDDSEIDSDSDTEDEDKDLKVENEDLKVENEEIDNELKKIDLIDIKDNDDFLNNEPIDINNLDDSSKKISINEVESDNKLAFKKNYSKMKVDDLKVLLVTQNIISNQDSQNMKKIDLIKLAKEKL